MRVSERARDQLIKLKRLTGIRQWNTLCRWALCTSLADPSPPADRLAANDSNVEMSWRTFGGEYERVYQVVLKERCRLDGLPADPETVAHQFRLHLHRGIASLAASNRLESISDLCALALNHPRSSHETKEDQPA